MVLKPKKVFDPTTFFAEIDEGRTINEYHENQIIFSQGDIADTVFYIRSGGVKLTVVSEQVAVLEGDNFFGEACLNGTSVNGNRNDPGYLADPEGCYDSRNSDVWRNVLLLIFSTELFELKPIWSISSLIPVKNTLRECC